MVWDIGLNEAFSMPGKMVQECPFMPVSVQKCTYIRIKAVLFRTDKEKRRKIHHGGTEARRKTPKKTRLKIFHHREHRDHREKSRHKSSFTDFWFNQVILR